MEFGRTGRAELRGGYSHSARCPSVEAVKIGLNGCAALMEVTCVRQAEVYLACAILQKPRERE